MGSAAPSRRRWFALPLLVVVGAVVVALWPWFDGGQPPALDSQPVDGGTTATAVEATTVAVQLEPGWSVPTLARPGEVGDGGEPAVADPLAAGAVSVGAEVEVPAAHREDESTVLLVHGVGSQRLAIRSGSDDGWQDWQEVVIGPDEGPDGLPGDEGAGEPRRSAGPLTIGREATTIELVVTGGDTSSFEMTFLSSTGPPPGSTVDVPAGPTAVAPAGGPAIIARDQWASKEWDYQNDSCDEGPPVADHIQAVVIHHTVTGNSYREDQVDDLLRAIRYSHVEINGWCDIGYNFVVDRFGRIWEARTGSIERAVIGGHARGFNRSTVGIALLGQHHAAASPAASVATTAAARAVEDLAHWKLEQHGVDPLGKTWLRNRSTRRPLRLAGDTWHYLPTVLGHRDIGVTSCPGSHGMGVVGALPDRLAAKRDLSRPYRFVGWQAHGHGPGFAVVDAGGGIRPAGSSSPWPQGPADLGGDGPAIAVGGNLDGGYLLTAAGSLLAYGDAPAVTGRPAGPAQPLDLVVRADGRSGWVLDASGAVTGFGGAADLDTSAGGSGSTAPVAVALVDDGTGYAVDSDGTLRPIGSAPPATAEGLPSDRVGIVDITLKTATSGWVLDDRGGLRGFGGVPSHQVDAAMPVVAVVASQEGPGGWVLDRQGQLWPFGDSRYVFPVSTDAGAADIVDVAVVGSVYSPAFLSGGDARFVASLYRLFLGRSPTSVEIDLDVTALEQGSRRRDLAGRMARSDHWAGATLDQMYLDVLGRNPDPDGRAYWLAEIRGGLKLQDLGTYFYGSREYADAAGSPEGYVTGLYEVLLDRPPDPEGLAYWVGLLESGASTPPDAASGFYASIESRRDRVDRLYGQILGRSPSSETREYWAERLPAMGDTGLAAQLAASAEFYRLAVDGPDP